ncbi:MAG: lipase maturation factor family protein, partial [Halobacteria archaeon]|nr:lipase maturation factor family protein [Halobacteria archaeon]
MSPWEPGSYWLVKLLLLKGVGTVYLIAFLVAAFQFRPLAGEEGLLPLDDYVERRKFRDSPSLFYVFHDDRVVGAAAWSGVTLSAVAVAGLPSVLGLGVAGHVAVWGALWLLYLSFVNAGQTFYGFGWETMLLETGFLTVFLGPMSMATPFVVVLLFRWLLFRNMLGAGLIKIRGDDCWRNLTCLDYHYETQPMPNPVSWFAHHLPKAVHRGGVLFNHVVELVVPFLYFAPQPVVAAAGVVTVLFQAWLMITGNFSWLNALTAVQALSTFDDATLSALVPFPLEKPAEVSTVPFGFEVAVWTLLGVVAVLSYYPVRNMISSGQRMNASFDPLHLVNTYGAFGSITKTRHEIVVQGTHDDEVTSDTDWHPYYFKGKPTETSRTPPQVAPYHLRLDWQM